MPSHRVADAGHVAPYLTHAVSHLGQVTLIPPDNAGRVRQGGKTRSRPRPDRSARPDENLRFNTGPRSLRTLVVNRAGRRSGRQDRRDEGPNDEVYPDYPPPSFQEAISTPPISVCPAPEPLASTPQSVQPAPINNLPPPSPLTQNLPSSLPQQPTTSQNLSDRDYDAESDSSLEIVEMEPDSGDRRARLEEGVKRDWINRRGVEFPSPPDNHPRGRSRGRAILDSDKDDIPHQEAHPEPLQHPARRRPMSLTPLRTFFPYRSMAVHDRAFSAQPSPSSSPYSSNSSFPFLSTTSLKMSMSTTSFTPSTKGESFLSRRLLPFKGKERAGSPESLESWEVVDSESPPSLTATVAKMEQPSTPPLLPSLSSTGSLIPSSGSVVADPNAAPSQGNIPQSPHPLSLRDRKVPPVPFVKPPRRPTPRPVPLQVDPLVACQGPVITTVRTRRAQSPPPSNNKPQTTSVSPLGNESWTATSCDTDSSSILQRALATPLPLTPIDSRHSGHEQATPVTPTLEVATPISPASPNSQMNIGHPLDQIAPCDSIGFSNQTIGDHLITGPLLGEELKTPNTPIDESPSSIRKHYPGRPLPRPPGSSRTLIDSIYAGNEDDSPNRADIPCPGGLLIDLDDEPPATGTSHISIPSANQDRYLSVPFSTTSSMSSVELSGPVPDSSEQPPMLIAPTPPVQASSPTAPFLDITDLDVLVSRLDEEHRNGSNYDALLSLSDFIGPATLIGNSTQVPQSPPASAKGSAQVSDPTQNVALRANVEVERRRTTKDGRVKLKLVLINTSVDRCGICLMQFKDGEPAKLGSVCRHAFHEKCIGRWLVRSKTCPMCRVPLLDQL